MLDLPTPSWGKFGEEIKEALSKDKGRAESPACELLAFYRPLISFNDMVCVHVNILIVNPLPHLFLLVANTAWKETWGIRNG